MNQKIIRLGNNPVENIAHLLAITAFPDPNDEESRLKYLAASHVKLSMLTANFMSLIPKDHCQIDAEFEELRQRIMLHSMNKPNLGYFGLLFRDSPNDILNQVANNMAKARWAGMILYCALALEFNHGGASTKNAVGIIQRLCSGKKGKDGTLTQASERHLFNCWKKRGGFRSVAHLEAAKILYAESSKDILIGKNVEHQKLFLRHAERFRILGQNTFPHPGKKPILEESDMWKIDYPEGLEPLEFSIPPLSEEAVSELDKIKSSRRE